MLNIAFKEWASVCLALARGHQSVILRKGGIAEDHGEFRPESTWFWLYPTYFHEQQQAGLKPEWQHLLAESAAAMPPAGQLHLRHLVEVTQVEYLTDLNEVLARQQLHVLNEATVTQRFHYRQPGLYLLRVRVTEQPTVIVPERPEYAGCKTWVELVDLPSESTQQDHTS